MLQQFTTVRLASHLQGRPFTSKKSSTTFLRKIEVDQTNRVGKELGTGTCNKPHYLNTLCLNRNAMSEAVEMRRYMCSNAPLPVRSRTSDDCIIHNLVVGRVVDKLEREMLQQFTTVRLAFPFTKAAS